MYRCWSNNKKRRGKRTTYHDNAQKSSIYNKEAAFSNGTQYTVGVAYIVCVLRFALLAPTTRSTHTEFKRICCTLSHTHGAQMWTPQCFSRKRSAEAKRPLKGPRKKRQSPWRCLRVGNLLPLVPGASVRLLVATSSRVEKRRGSQPSQRALGLTRDPLPRPCLRKRICSLLRRS